MDTIWTPNSEAKVDVGRQFQTLIKKWRREYWLENYGEVSPGQKVKINIDRSQACGKLYSVRGRGSQLTSLFGHTYRYDYFFLVR